MICILGPTASGKTAIATKLAARVGGEIISADSRQVYRRMDIGTGKDLDDYVLSDGEKIPYHLIDIVEPGTKYNLFQYMRDFHVVYDDIVKRGKMPILCGGTGLYIEAVLKGYQLADVPQNEELRNRLKDKSLEELTEMLTRLKEQNGSNMHNTTDVDTAQRAIRAIEIETYMKDFKQSVQGEEMKPLMDSTLVVGVGIDRELRRRKITDRLYQRLDDGMVDEVRRLLAEGIKPEDLIYYGLEYKYLTLYATGQMEYDEMVKKLEISIHQFAKRQMTWFRGMERRGIKINWVERPENDEELEVTVERILQLAK